MLNFGPCLVVHPCAEKKENLLRNSLQTCGNKSKLDLTPYGDDLSESKCLLSTAHK